MARAKHTARADARRRYRQTTTATAVPEGDAAAVSSAPVRRGAAPGGAAAPAPSIGGAFRAAYRPPDVRGDIAALPSLLASRAFLASVALVLVGGVTFLLPANSVTAFVFQTLTLPPAMAPVFVAGWFAPRASYLLGLLVGLVDLVVYAGLLLWRAPAAGVTNDQLTQLLVSAAAIGPVSGLVFASAAAWYRRFLAISGAARARSRQGSSNRARRR